MSLIIGGLVMLCVAQGGGGGGGGWSSVQDPAVSLALFSNLGNATRNVLMKVCTAKGHHISSHVTLCLQSLVSLALLAAAVPARLAWETWPGGPGAEAGRGARGIVEAALDMVEDAAAGTAAAPAAFALGCLAFGVEQCRSTVSKPELNVPLVSTPEVVL